MYSKIKWLEFALVIGLIFFVILDWFSYSHLKKRELEFNEKKAALIKENLDLGDLLESNQEIIARKIESITHLSKEKKSLENALDVLEKEMNHLNQKSKTYSEQIELLKRENIALAGRTAESQKKSTPQLIRQALYKQEGEDIQRVLEEALDKIERVQAGESIELEPAPTVDKEGVSSVTFITSEEKIEKLGNVLLLDKGYNIVIIDLGYKDNIKEGARCVIIENEEEIASGEIISVRHAVSAAFIDEMRYEYSLQDIKEGYNALILE